MTPAEREALRKAMREQAERDCATRETALAALVRLGTHNPDGSLTREYGGERTDDVERAPPPTFPRRKTGAERLEEFREAARRYAERVCATPESARAELVRMGMANPDGTLTRTYGGEYTALDEHRVPDDRIMPYSGG